MLTITGGGIVVCTANDSEKKLISPNACIYFILSGQGKCDNHSLSANNGFFVHADGFIQHVQDDSDPWTYAWFSLGGEDTEGVLKNVNGEKSAEIFSLSDTRVLDIIKALCPQGEYVSLGESFDQAAARLLLSLPSCKERAVFSPRSGKAHVDEAVKYINENYSSDIKVEQIASELGIDRKYLRNLFAQHMGMSTMDYLMNTRMDRAKELLTSGDISVSLVASSVGYKDVLCFSKAFKKFTGVSPTEYRSTSKELPAKRKTEEVKQEKPQPSAAPKKKKEQMPVFYL
jgi:AraC family transcriptional regulator of arabinose operon